MESTADVLRATERAAAAPFLDYPRTPWWYPPFMAAALTLGLSGPVWSDRGHAGVGTVCAVLGVAAMLAFFAWYRSRWGVWPRLQAAPREIVGAYRWFATGVLVVVLMVTMNWLMVGPAAGLVSAFLLVTVFLWGYERRVYPAAAQRARERLA